MLTYITHTYIYTYKCMYTFRVSKIGHFGNPSWVWDESGHPSFGLRGNLVGIAVAFPGSTPVPRTAAHWKPGWIYMEILTTPGMVQNDWDPKMVQYFKICCTPFFAPGFFGHSRHESLPSFPSINISNSSHWLVIFPYLPMTNDGFPTSSHIFSD
jgi:hypothetical protein